MTMPPNMTDYEATCAEFRVPGPERFNFARDVVDRWAAQSADHEALRLVDDAGNERRVTFAQVSERSRRLAAALTACGLKRGDVVIVVLGRELAWWETVTACLRAGIVVAPGTTQLSAQDLGYRARTARAAAIVTNAACAEKAERADPSPPLRVLVGASRPGWTEYESLVASGSDAFETVDTGADDDALYYFTSGTTGYPKMTVHRHAYPLGHEATGRYWIDLHPGDLHWNISDTGWAKAAWSSYCAPWLQGASVFVHQTAGFDAGRTLDLLERHPVTTLCAPPTAYRMFVQQDLSARKFQTLRHCVGAGEPLNPEVIAQWHDATGLTVRDGYGQTETAILCGSFPPLAVKPGSMGRPAPGITLAIVDDAGREVPDGTEGDIAVKVKPAPPAGFFRGYKDDPERTAACFRGDWYLTGDRGVRDADGYFWFVGRADDVILSAGYRIGPFEVESALIEHPAVAESAVVSSPDPVRGEVVKAFVVLAAGHEPSVALVRELQEHVKTTTAPYKYPRRIEFVESLPKTVSGKIRRVDLRNREWGRS
jgi:acetyl-CoA synthetase/medium-chain acyl-CoA synthetase